MRKCYSILGVLLVVLPIFLMWYRGFFVPFVPTPHVATNSHAGIRYDKSLLEKITSLMTLSNSTLQVPLTASTGALEFLNKAKEQIGIVKTYDHGNGYYSRGGFPPDDTGVCSDVIWRAYRDVGIDFKKEFQRDIEKNPIPYEFDLDSNINFRRVKRLQVYFSHTATPLTNEILPNSIENLVTWQPGDIVIFDVLPSNHLWHVAIIGDTRRDDGVPYMLDNHGSGVDITITPLDWPTKVIGHFRPF